MLCSELLIRLHTLFLQSPYQSVNFCHFGSKSEEMQINPQKTPQKARHSVANAGPFIIYFSINFLAALSWCLITLRNSWLSCSTFR